MTTSRRFHAYSGRHQHLTVLAGLTLLATAAGCPASDGVIIDPILGSASLPATLVAGQTPGASDQTQLRIASSGESVLGLWVDRRDGTSRIYFARSLDAGRTFTAEVVVDDSSAGVGAYDPKTALTFPTNTYNDPDPALAAGANGVLAACWADHRLGRGRSRIFAAVSRDGGLSFGKNLAITGDTSEEAIDRLPAVAIDGGGTIYLFWTRESLQSSTAYLARSFDGGESFEQPRRLAAGFVVLAAAPLATSAVAASLRAQDQSSGTIAFSSNRGDSFRFSPQPFILASLAQMSDGRLAGVTVAGDALTFRASSDQGATFTDPVTIGLDQPSTPLSAKLATSISGTTIIAWSDTVPPANCCMTQAAYYAESLDGGKTFSTGRRVDASARGVSPSADPDATITSAGTVVASWGTLAAGDHWDSWISSRQPGEVDFPAPVRPDRTAAAQTGESVPVLAIDNALTRHIVWLETTASTDRVQYRAYDDDRGFGEVATLAERPRGELGAPAIAAGPGGALVAVWEQGDVLAGKNIFVSTKSAGAHAFGTPHPVAPFCTVNCPVQTGSRRRPAVTVSNTGRVYVAWGEQSADYYSTTHVFLAASRDGGASFLRPVEASTGGVARTGMRIPTQGPDRAPGLAIGTDGAIYVAFLGGGASELDYSGLEVAVSTDGGHSIAYRAHLGGAGGDTVAFALGRPALAFDAAARLHIAWIEDNRGDASAAWAVSTDGARSFGAPVAVLDSEPARSGADPALAFAVPGEVQLVWADVRNGTPQLYTAAIPATGGTFGGSSLVDPAGWARQDDAAAVTGEDGAAILVWSDTRNGDRDIYMKSMP